MSDSPEPAAAPPRHSDPAAPGGQTRKWLVFIIVAVLSLVADQATKIWARDSLPTGRYDRTKTMCIVPDDMMAQRTVSRGDARTAPPACHGEQVAVIDGFWDWRLSMNPGSAFGLFSSQNGARWFLSIVGIGAVLGMLWMLRKSRPDQRILHWALALVAGGAVGNLIDRIYFGVVTDFVLWRYQTHEWPVFNVADVVLVVGVGLMFIDIQKEGGRDKARKARRDAKAKAAGLVKTFDRK
jgi:signal peptidase II